MTKSKITVLLLYITVRERIKTTYRKVTTKGVSICSTCVANTLNRGIMMIYLKKKNTHTGQINQVYHLSYIRTTIPCVPMSKVGFKVIMLSAYFVFSQDIECDVLLQRCFLVQGNPDNSFKKGRCTFLFK